MKRSILLLFGIIYFIINGILILLWIIVLNSENKPIHPYFVIFPLIANFLPSYLLIRYNVYKSLVTALIFIFLIYVVLYFLPGVAMNPSVLPLTISNINLSISILFSFFPLLVCLLIFKLFTSKRQKSSIKQYVLEMSTKSTRLGIKEVSEKTKQDKDTIKRVLKSMSKNQEVIARYFRTTHSLVFDQDANIEEIDNLMEAFRKWESE